jgi:hypothetical protein
LKEAIGLMNIKMMTRRATLALFMIGLTAGTSAWAYAPENDLLKIKGYSPEVIQTASTQRSRQEWREPAPPKLSPTARFFRNIYTGNWTDSVDEFGSTVIRNY